ncbi:DUF4124 domain-containing protein [Thalassotalea agarivorans]|uniref:DUF4124 domain-containing protein n=1 Tax=Thalassotalea agarivorans TaxID=349064 RepID=A0A1I0HV69_THASX|nr:DUF4124 domain-containing protein [Thalassotalea agarivorans]SET87969.1 protein of unknown function [Thalassotalea agarivorans]
MFKQLAFVLFCIVFAVPVNAVQAKVYVWRNEDGVLVFSDTPKPGAEEMEVESTNVVQSSVDTSILDIKKQAPKDEYTVTITQPASDATIRDNTGSVHVTGQIGPVFKRGFKIQLIVDGQPYEKPQTHTMFALRDIDRGEHQLKMQLIDTNGKVIATSEEVTFYMHRAALKKRAR